MENNNPPTYIILPTEVDYVKNVIFSTVSPDKFLFAMLGHSCELPTVTKFDIYLNLN